MKYKGYTPLKKGQEVELLSLDEVYAQAKVFDALATQFTIKVKGKVRFFFYEDKGITWQKTSE